MRRGGQVSIAGGGGYNKPPPGPLSHASGSRMRLHTHDANGATMKDRFGSPRERSPSLGSSLPLSPSHLNAREKSPNPTSQDLHDCSMCLSAYIQSLNTVCGTACRLAQCLAQVGADNGCNEASGTGTPLHQLLKEAAEMWEGIARAVGVASTSVKNQMLILLQESQARHTMEYSESARKLEVAKIMRTMLSTFLNLHCQFSLVVVERFSGMLQHLKEENGDSSGGPNGVYSAANLEGGHRPSPSPSVSPHRPSPSPPQPNTQYPHLSSQQLLQHHQQLLQQQQQQQLALQQQILLHQMLHLNCNKNVAAIEVSRTEENGSRHSSGGSSAALQAPVPTIWSTSLGSPISSYSSQNSGNTLSPGMCGVGGGDNSSDAISRRWSMGGASEDACHDKFSSLTPFSLIANRRWSVPETTEHDTNSSGFAGLHPFYGSDYVGSAPIGRNSQNRGYSKGNSHLISRESSCARSPSHSRSVTPDQSRRVSVVSSEELQDVIELLSFPLNGAKEEKTSSLPSKPAGKHFPSVSQKGMDESNPHHHSIPENEHESQGLPSPSSFSTSSPRSIHDTSRTSVPSEKGKSKEEAAVKMFQQNLWSENPPEETITSSGLHKNIPEEVVLKDNTNQISTSLWPPTDNVPGVTLTECVGETEKRVIAPWSDENSCCDERSSVECFNRDSINRASWPISAFSSLGIVDDTLPGSPGGSQGGWASRPNVVTFRRHSTDAPFLLPQGIHSPLSAKTRSFENIAFKVNGNNNNNSFSGGGIDTNIQDLFLPSLHSTFSSTSSPTTSHYTLFTTSS